MKKISKYETGIFFISFATLLYELSLTRVYSVTLWYHFGFLIISTALLGFGVSGVVLSLWKNLREKYDLDKSLGWLGLCLSIIIIICFWLQQQIPFDPFNLYTDKMQFAYMPLTYLLVSTPFFFSGLTISLLFSRYPSNINRLYAFDLAGAAMGCLAIILTISWFGGGGSVLFAAVFSSLAALVFSNKTNKALAGLAGLLIVSSFLIALNADKIIPLHITANKGLSRVKIKPAYTKWNTFSRVDLYIENSSIDSQKKSPGFAIDQGTAFTGLDFDLKPDVKTVLGKYNADSLYGTCVAYLNKKDPSILIIGSGCGSQVLDALHHGARQITAVEINSIINDVVANNEYWSDLFHQPEVKLVTDEGRNYVRSSKENYDAILSVHTISNAAIASGALSLSENYVLTKEAFEDYYEHLTDSGVILFTRPEFQLPRLFATCREVLEEKGIKDPSTHFFSYAYDEGPALPAGRKSFYSIFLMSKAPFSVEQVSQMNTFISPARILYDPFKQNKNIFDSVLTTKNLNTFYHNYPFEISPSTDNEPFFNHHTRWSSLNWSSFKDIFSQKRMGRMALEDKPIAEVSLIVLLVQVLIISAILILLPLWRFSSDGLKASGVFPYLLYFAGLGAGFIMIEIVMLQQFGLLLGEPVYTFAIVLAALLLFTGLGAYLSGKYSLHANRTLRMAILLLSALLLVASFLLTPVLQRAISLPMTGRIILSLLIILPMGILLGIPFPSGIQMVSKQSASLIPWAWGVNGFFTVIGSVIALMLSMMIGFQAVIWIAIVIYLMSLFFINKAANRK